MKVKILKKCFTGHGGNHFPGDVVELPDSAAEKIIANGYAEEEKKPRKSNRMISKVTTPEDEE